MGRFLLIIFLGTASIANAQDQKQLEAFFETKSSTEGISTSNRSYPTNIQPAYPKLIFDDWLKAQDIEIQKSLYSNLELQATKEIKNQLSSEYGAVGNLLGGMLVQQSKDNEKARIEKLRQQELAKRKQEMDRVISGFRNEFTETLQSPQIEIVSEVNENFFYILAISGDSVQFALFNVFKTGQGLLPYGVTIKDAYSRQFPTDKPYLFGPFPNLADALSDLRLKADLAYKAYLNIGPDREFVFHQTGINNGNSDTPEKSEGDSFWGMNKKLKKNR